MRVEGVPLGLLESREFEEVTFQARPGDTLVLYSDGITDHMSPTGAEFGRSRLAQLVRANFEKPAGRIVTEIYKELDGFNTTAFDDQTVFVLKVK